MVKDVIDEYYQFIKAHEWTYKQASEKIGCCRTHLGRIFNGKRAPSMNLLIKMEEVMKNAK